MNLAMWNTPQVQEAVRRLGKEALVVPPLVEEGKAKYPPPEDVVEHVIDVTAPRDYEGLRVLVTAGPTREYLDDVKYLTTPSSGLTGYYFAREAAARGAEVSLVMGPTGLRPPGNVAVVKVTSVLEMYQAVAERAKQHHVFIFAAAPLDFYVEKKISGKIDSSLPQYQVTLRQAPKIAQDVKKYNPDAVVIGFKAEHNVDEAELLERARRRMEEGLWDMALAHDVANMGFGGLKDRYLLLTREGAEVLGPAHKRELARAVLTAARGQLKRLN
jgi:phosphopantothenoylcysteine decarboxylase/phosphopantothenate--cysteine ligase